MKNTAELEYCYGCGTCVGCCPHNVLRLTRTQDGFFKPTAHTPENCVSCGICLKTCSFLDSLTTEKNGVKGYSGRTTDESQLSKSTSGGIAFSIASELISDGWVFIGVTYDCTNNKTEYYPIHDIKDWDILNGSKYIPTAASNLIATIKKCPKAVIIGTPCLISSIHKAKNLNIIKSELILIDFFCHGIPSLNMWDKYLARISKGLDVKAFSWRNKISDWHNSSTIHIVTSEFSRYSSLSEGDLFYKFFLGDRCLGKQCYDNCKFKHLNSDADIRIGDLWGPKYANDTNGISGIIAFTNKGSSIIRNLSQSGRAIISTEDIETILTGQLRHNPTRPPSYNIVRKLLSTTTGISTINHIANLFESPRKIKKLPRRIINRIKRLINKS